MNKYDEVDQKIIAAIKSGLVQFYQIDARLDANDFRLIDRRLQALRKMGVVQYDRRHGWGIATKARK